MTKYLTLDIETHDEFIDMDYGSGWVYKLKYDSDKYEVIGVAVITHDGHKEYITDFSLLKNLIESHDVIIGHNLSYDLGGLLTIGLESSIKDKPIIDTYIMSKLYDSSLMNYSLDFLSKKYLNKSKDNQLLIDTVVDNDLYPWLKKDIKARDKAEKKGEVFKRVVDEKKVLKWVKSHMRLIQQHHKDVISHYALQDTILTYCLFKKLQYSELYDDMLKMSLKYSFVIHITMSYRIRGIRVDLMATREAVKEIQPFVSNMYKNIYSLAGQEFNINSFKQMAEVFDKLNIPYNSTSKGNPTFTSAWMKSQNHDICKIIYKLRSYELVLNTFVKKILLMQQEILGLTSEEVDKLDYGVVYPELHLLRAKTGRFSSTNPNIQQIPKRDKFLGPICRRMFVPFKNEKWYSLDYSNQEGRLHLHYAILLNCSGTEVYLDEFNKDSTFDVHSKVAELCKIERSPAKGIYLGISYGMGGGKTCRELGLPTKMWTPDNSDVAIEIAGDEGRILINTFNEMLPYLKELSNKCTDSLKSKKYIKTVCGRKLRPEIVVENKKFKSLYYRALNLLSQGSAADQLIEAMIYIYKAGVQVSCVVHDEINLSSNRYEDASISSHLMYEAVQLVVPQYISIGCGDNWDDAK